MTEKPKTTHLKDYRAPDYLIPEVELHFDIFKEKTVVRSRLKITPNHTGPFLRPLELNGEELKLNWVKLNGKELDQSQFRLTDKLLTIPCANQCWAKTLGDTPAQGTPTCILEIENEIDPASNKALDGLYKSGNIFCTQNEAEGFRRITFFIDRPDVMGRFTTTITADKVKYPILLSNGNKIESRDLPEGRHFVRWQDPFKKPCYLFALVAGDLGVIEDVFTTKSGRKIVLKIFVDKGNESRTSHAMESLKQAMKWDEDTYGLECDLDTYMIVVVDAFNSGAMENKGLNIFNTQCALADPESATDTEYQYIERVVAHEYFHNWTGNRVTCRDWFQLTLKEGLTVFRDQEFTSDMSSRAVKRITDVTNLRNAQFIEDAGPNAHPIRPDSYIEISNFYTPTVYEKGAEVIRMIQTFIGKEKFRKGIEKYFELFDGGAVTTEDFVRAMELASGLDLTQFKNWYSQAGTPVCKVRMNYDKASQTAEFVVEQSCPATPESPEKKPFYFPLAVGLLDSKGKDIPLTPTLSREGRGCTTEILHVKDARQTFHFKNIPERPLPSLLRNFSAPVKLDYPYALDELIFLLAHDADLFNRYEAGYRIATTVLDKIIKGKLWCRCAEGGSPDTGAKLSEEIISKITQAFGRQFETGREDPAFAAEVLTLPSVTALVEEMDICDFEGAFKAREELTRILARGLENHFLLMYENLGQDPSDLMTSEAMARRALKNTCLRYLFALGKDEYVALTFAQFVAAQNMTDKIAALRLLCDTAVLERDEALGMFYERWKNDPTVINKWFVVQASSKLPDTLERVKRLEKDPAFDPKNPNRQRSLYGVFAQNLPRFHDASGSGYRYLADKVIEIDNFNPSMAGRFATQFKKYAKLDPTCKALMARELERILAVKGLSNAVYEIVSKTLKAGVI